MNLFNIVRHLTANKPRTGLTQAEALARIDEGLATMVGRRRFMGEELVLGPNWVHALIGRGPSGEYGRPGTFEDLGWARNLRTNNGMDLIHGQIGGHIASTQTLGAMTSVTATTAVKTAAGWTTDAYKGKRVVVPVTGLTTEPVYGNILSNDATTLQLDQWWKADDTTGTTPAGTSAMLLLPGFAPARFIALTENTGAPAITDTALTGELTTNGMNRALATYAHTTNAETFTLTKTWTATGGTGAIYKAGQMTGGYGSAGGGFMVAETVLNATATLATNDTLQVTWTWTLPDAGS